MRRSDLRDLKRFELLTELSDTDREVLAQELDVRELAAGKRLFEVGEPSDSLILVMDGCVRIRRPGGDGAFADLGPGSCIGALSLGGETQHETRADTTGPVKLFELSRHSFERLVVAEPRTACRLLQAILRDHVGLLYEAAQALGAVDAPTPDES